MFKVNPLAHQPITPLSSSPPPPPPLQQHHSNDDQHTILPCSNNNNSNNNENRATTTAGTCANGGRIMHRIDPECMNRIEHKFTQYYCQVIENDERKTFHHHLPQLLSTASVASTNNNAMIEKMKRYKNWVVIRHFVVQCVRMIRRLILPVLSCSTPIVIYVLYATITIAAQRQNQRSNFPERIRHHLRSIIARMRKRIMASKSRILQPTPTPTSTPTLTIVHHFNLIEMLIAISILVTFSSLTSSLYHQKLYSSRVQFTKIQLHLANQALLLLHAETGVHPLHVPRALLEGEQQVELKDAWSHDFIYVPFIDLDQLVTTAASTTVTTAKNLKSGSQSSGSSRSSSSTAAAMEVVADLIAIHGHAPEILYLASRSEFFFAEGPKGVIFGEEVSDQNKRYILSVVKKMREGTRLKSVIQQQHQQQQPSSQSTLEES